MKEKITIVWLKRDLRTHDHLPLEKALKSKYKILLIYIFEPLIRNHHDFSTRHWKFIWQSLKNIKTLVPVNIFEQHAHEVFKNLIEQFDVKQVYSHQETGLDHTFKRDIQIKKLLNSNDIPWKEFTHNGVLRALRTRNNWEKRWTSYMNAPINSTNLNPERFIELYNQDISESLEKELSSLNGSTQDGGEDLALKNLDLFLTDKVNQYFYHISSPDKSRYYCSRLSPYLAYGCLSTRFVYQRCKELKKSDAKTNTRSINQFMNRLRWQAHFIQKLEIQTNIEYKNLNSAYNSIRNHKNKNFIKAWKSGMTGYPLVDAAMRCVNQTGYLNFRLRAMVTSFFTHHLWQPWQAGATYLAKQFLDYEPGIHYSQFQMQAGTTGINTLRIYNPVKQSIDKDPDAKFIKEWIPELRDLSINLIHKPWEITPMEEQMYQFEYGKHYPLRIVDHEEAARQARDKLWSVKKSDYSKYESLKVLDKHVNKNRRRGRR